MNRLIPISLLMLAAGCTSAPADLSGHWHREAQEPAMSLAGTETLEFLPDSTFIIMNQMLFSHADTALSCSLNLTINTVGTWSRNNQNDVLLLYCADSVRIEPDSTSFILHVKGADTELPSEMIEETFSDLISRINEYYTQGYSAISANGGILLMSPQIIDSCLYARIGTETFCWTRR